MLQTVPRLVGRLYTDEYDIGRGATLVVSGNAFNCIRDGHHQDQRAYTHEPGTLFPSFSDPLYR